MIEFTEEDATCVIAGEPITTGPLEFTCGNYTQCDNGNLTALECLDGFRFDSTSEECTDAREVPECDIDECALWSNGTTDSGNLQYIGCT